MPEFALFFAPALAVVVTTGGVLDRKKVRRSHRVLVWTTLFLLLPFCFVLFFLVLMALNWHSC